jgi:hypothetical protein
MRRIKFWLVVLAAIVVAIAIILYPPLIGSSMSPKPAQTAGDPTSYIIIAMTLFGAAWVYNEKIDARHDATERAIDKLVAQNEALAKEIKDLQQLLNHEANHRRVMQDHLADLTEWAQRRTPHEFHARKRYRNTTLPPGSVTVDPGSPADSSEPYTSPLSPWARDPRP